MTINKRKKNSRQRGSKTHGWGSMKKHRGAGHRGGRGMAGSGKRADHKKQLILKIFGTEYFGKHGFTSHKPKIKVKAINISYLEDKFNQLLKQGLIKQEKDICQIDLSKLKFNKLLAAGKPTKKYKILTKFFSKSAKEKIEKAGGEIVSI